MDVNRKMETRPRTYETGYEDAVADMENARDASLDEPQPAPTDPVTLKKLARVGWEAWQKAQREQHLNYLDDWDSLRESDRISEIAQARAVANAVAAPLVARIAAVTAERDLYKPYYDAVIDMAVVNWTLDGLSEKDAHYAIQKLIWQHIQESVDPALNEELAKRDAQIAAVTAERDSLRAELAARTTRPVKVRFTNGMDLVIGNKIHTTLSVTDFDYRATAIAVLDLVSRNAVIDVPPGIPTVHQVLSEWKYGDPPLVEFTFNRLAPYLRPALVLPDREALAKALHEAYRDSYQDVCIVKWGYLTESHLNARIAQADAALQMFRELNPEGGQG